MSPWHTTDVSRCDDPIQIVKRETSTFGPPMSTVTPARNSQSDWHH